MPKGVPVPSCFECRLVTAFAWPLGLQSISLFGAPLDLKTPVMHKRGERDLRRMATLNMPASKQAENTTTPQGPACAARKQVLGQGRAFVTWELGARAW